MTRLLAVPFFVFVVCVVAYGQQPERKAAPAERLTAEELTQVIGWWELKVDPKTGWEGTIYLNIRLHNPRGSGNYIFLNYDVGLQRIDG